MKVLVTGASGFVGGAAASKLNQKHEVWGLARSDNSAAKVSALGLQVLPADLLSLTAEHLKGFDAVIHCAAFAEEWGSYNDFYQANVTGTNRILQAAARAGVKKFVFIGTEAAFFTGKALVNIDESQPYPSSSPFYYSRTKAIAEQRVLEANTPEFKTLSIRPRLVWGPGDQSVLPAVINMVNKGSFMWLNGGRYKTSVTYIGNLVRAISLALESELGGKAWFVANDETLTIKEFLTRLIETQGVKVPTRSAPAWLARTLALCVETVYRLFRLKGQPPMTRFAVCMMSAEITVKNDQIKKDLGYTEKISIDEGMKLLTMESRR